MCGAVIRTLLVTAVGVSVAAQGLEPPRIVKRTRPLEFPPQALAEMREAIVRYIVRVGVDGKPVSISIQDEAQTDRSFVAAVQDAVASWEFEPAKQNGSAVAGVLPGASEFLLEGDLSSARMYGASSAAAWQAVDRIVRDLKLPIEKRDDAHQLIVTRWFKAAEQAGRLLRPIAVPSGLDVGSIRLSIFVSPYVEPAHLHVDSMVATETRMPLVSGKRQSFVFYDLPSASGALVSRVDAALGEGRSMPRSFFKRRRLARQLMPSIGSDSCLGEPPIAAAETTTPGSSMPRKIVDEPPLYPDPALRNRTEGTTLLHMLILEDGAVLATDVMKTVGESSFEKAAGNTLAFWRMDPGRYAGCPVPMRATFEATFRVQ